MARNDQPDRPWRDPARQVPPPPSGPPTIGDRGGLPFSTGPSAVLTDSVDLRVSKRLLWVGGAAYPLHNIVRVYAFVLMPKRKEAVLRFARQLVQALTLALLAVVGAGFPFGVGKDVEPFKGPALVVALLWAGYGFLAMFGVLAAPAVPVLAVDTAGNATALVGTADRGRLREAVRILSHALENPEIELELSIRSLTVNAGNYHFGDNVNMYGGSGNTGKATG
ncbi:DUF6232 family protein [Streptomyces sp. XY431]|uniref:DUF6232 family protein n=1 Tax=Streptomyces sp. XY431 TaxID=1415562 RepID=UPI000A869E7A|nr:DUF6232 family protein [Streptomyces sp. XY431]